MIDTENLILRTWTDSDRAPFAQMNADPRVTEFLGHPMTRAASDAAIDRQLELIAQKEPAFWAVEQKHEGQFIGCIGVKPIRFKAEFTPAYEIGWRLAASAWGCGYATEGAKAAISYVFENWNLTDIYSFTVPANIRSQSVMKKIGMSLIEGGDFNHPNLPPDDPLSLHMLYKITRSNSA